MGLSGLRRPRLSGVTGERLLVAETGDWAGLPAVSLSPLCSGLRLEDSVDTELCLGPCSDGDVVHAGLSSLDVR